MIFPDFTGFARLAAHGNLVPVYREIMADMDTPVTAFHKIDDGRHSFYWKVSRGGRNGAAIHFSVPILH